MGYPSHLAPWLRTMVLIKGSQIKRPAFAPLCFQGSLHVSRLHREPPNHFSGCVVTSGTSRTAFFRRCKRRASVTLDASASGDSEGRGRNPRCANDVIRASARKARSGAREKGIPVRAVRECRWPRPAHLRPVPRIQLATARREHWNVDAETF